MATMPVVLVLIRHRGRLCVAPLQFVDEGLLGIGAWKNIMPLSSLVLLSEVMVTLSLRIIS